MRLNFYNLARLHPAGMVWALVTAAFAQALVGVIALIAGLSFPTSPPLEIVGVSAFFILPFVVSALLFRHAALEQAAATGSEV